MQRKTIIGNHSKFKMVAVYSKEYNELFPQTRERGTLQTNKNGKHAQLCIQIKINLFTTRIPLS